MPPRITILYNQPETPASYAAERQAIFGVLEEVRAVRGALDELGYPVTELAVRPPLENIKASLVKLAPEIVFNLFEGFPGWPESEPAMARLLANLKLRFTGCRADTLELALDKTRAKSLLLANAIATPRWRLLAGGELAAFDLDFPCIVKPFAEDASHGISPQSVVSDRAALAAQVERISRTYGGKALIEEFIDGREFNTTVLGGGEPEVLPVSEIVFRLPPDMPKILTYAAKWEPASEYYTGTQVRCPADISETRRQQVQSAARRTFKLFGGAGYARIDFRSDSLGRLYVLELNPNPDISPDAGAARQARARGWSFARFVERIVAIALEEC